MATLTIRHAHGAPLRPMLGGLLLAWRRARQGGAIQRIWSSRVSASVRATEVTLGTNGWHPHVHALLRTTDWSPGERDALLDRWQSIVRKVLGEAHVPSPERAIHWSREHDGGVAAYVAKLGYEITGHDKGARGGSLSSWELATRAAVDRDPELERRWVEYQLATKGRRMIELDDRAHKLAQVPRTLTGGPAPDGGVELEYTSELTPPGRVTVVALSDLDVHSLHFAERSMPDAAWHLLRAVESSDAPVSCAREWLRNMSAA